MSSVETISPTRLGGLALVAVTAVAPVVWGSTYAVTHLWLPADRPLFAGAMRVLPVGLLMLGWHRRLPRGDWWWRSAVLCTLTMGLFFGLLYVAAVRLPSGLGATLTAISPMVTMALAWLLHQDGVTGPIIGPRTGQQLDGALRALDITLDAEALARRRSLLERFEALRPGSPGALLALAEAAGAGREEAEEALGFLALWNRDVAVARAGGSAFVNLDLAALAREAAARTSPEVLHRRHTLIDEARHAIGARNGSPRLQLERMLVEMVEGR